MKTHKFFVILFCLASTILVLSCSGLVNSKENKENQTSTGENKTETTVTTEPIISTGTIAQPITDANGNITLTCTDSNNGAFVFVQKNNANRSATGGTWTYSVATVVKFSGSYTGDISSIENLSLVVEKAADENGNLKNAEKTKSFSFVVSTEGTFETTIPSVEIKVSKTEEKPNTSKNTLIKTVTWKDISSVVSVEYKFNLYSDESAECYVTYSKNYAMFSYTIEGIYGVGTYKGNPLEDGIIELYFDKLNLAFESLYAEEIYQAFKEGRSTVTITAKESDLIKVNDCYSLEIQGDTAEILFDNSNFFNTEFLATADGSTGFEVKIKGDEAESFKLSYSSMSEGGHYEGTKTAAFPVQEYLTSITEEVSMQLFAFIDSNNNEEIDRNEEIDVGTSTKLIPGHKTIVEFDIVKTTINFTVLGDTSIFTNPKIVANKKRRGSSSTFYTDIEEGFITVYGNKNSKYGYNTDLTAFDDLDDDGIYNSNYDNLISDSVQIAIDEGETSATINLYSEGESYTKLPANEQIRFCDTLDEVAVNNLTEEQLTHYGFFRTDEEDSPIYFYIPAGEKTDGSFITCYQCETQENPEYHSGDHFWSLLDYCFIFPSISQEVEKNYEGQYSGLTQNMQDIVTVLETHKGFTVFGKDLIGM